MKDFSLQLYKKLLKVIIKSDYNLYTFEEFVIKNPKNNSIILRHDLCNNPVDSLRIAELEASFDIHSSFYFRINHKYRYDEILSHISSLGHEIGLHYDSLDKANGDFEIAKSIFKKELQFINNFYPVKTISMHGNPLTKYDNKNIISNELLNELSLLADTYLYGAKFLYLTDTGRSYNDKFNIKDYMPNSIPNNFINNTFDLIKFIQNNSYNFNIMILVHPIRWSDNSYLWVRQYILDIIKNIAKKIYTFKN